MDGEGGFASAAGILSHGLWSHEEQEWSNGGNGPMALVRVFTVHNLSPLHFMSWFFKTHLAQTTWICTPLRDFWHEKGAPERPLVHRVMRHFL